MLSPFFSLFCEALPFLTSIITLIGLLLLSLNAKPSLLQNYSAWRLSKAALCLASREYYQIGLPESPHNVQSCLANYQFLLLRFLAETEHNKRSKTEHFWLKHNITKSLIFLKPFAHGYHCSGLEIVTSRVRTYLGATLNRKIFK